MKIPVWRNPAFAGWGAALLMVLIASGWQLATRAGARSQLAPVDLALLRYTIPALLLAPLWWRPGGLLPATASRVQVALIVTGAGLPFGLLAMAGAHFAPVAHMGALLPGASPLLVTLAAWLWLGSRPRRIQVAGLCLLGAGLAAVSLASWTSDSSSWIGDVLFLAAALLWAIYTLALRESGLGPWQSAALVSAWSAMAVIPLWALAFASGRSLMPFAGAAAILTQAVWQGLVAGVAGMAVFGIAVKQIGAAATTTVGALVPAVVAAGGWLLLGETLEPAAWAGVIAVVGGVALATRNTRQTTAVPTPLRSHRTAP